MTLENEIKMERERTDDLLKKVTAARPEMPHYPTYANLGDLKRFNHLLAEITDIFKTVETCECGERIIYKDGKCWSCFEEEGE